MPSYLSIAHTQADGFFKKSSGDMMSKVDPFIIVALASAKKKSW